MTMQSEPGPRPRRRRSQAERRAKTRAALLDATIGCLVEYGYANVTTARIAERAGVTRGAQTHHFSSKQELVTEALRHLTGKLVAEVVENVTTRSRNERRRLGLVLDRPWEVHTGPLFAAAMELWVAGRTDLELKTNLLALDREIRQTMSTVSLQLLPSLVSRPQSGRLLDSAMATIRGMAMLTFVADPAEVQRRWEFAKEEILEFASQMMEPAEHSSASV
jgi:AcrR family transcriptional regulator